MKKTMFIFMISFITFMIKSEDPEIIINQLEQLYKEIEELNDPKNQKYQLNMKIYNTCHILTTYINTRDNYLYTHGEDLPKSFNNQVHDKFISIYTLLSNKIIYGIGPAENIKLQQRLFILKNKLTTHSILTNNNNI